MSQTPDASKPAADSNENAGHAETRPPDAAGEPPARPGRLMSLDVYRGMVMVLLASGGFGVAAVAKEMDSPIWQWLAFQTSHPEWISQFHVMGFSLWDMIQPSFMFMVGVAMPFSYARRRSEGHSHAKLWTHAVVRAAALVALGVFLTSQWADQTEFEFFNVLCQIGLGYVFAFMLLGCRFWLQVAAAALILVGYWLLFVLYPLPAPGFDYAAAGIDPAATPELFRHFAKNANAAWRFDVWFLNLFPRAETFETNAGGYTTLNFIPSIVTMLIGAMAGGLLRRTRPDRQKLVFLVLGGVVCMAAALAAGYTVCPIVKRIWTPSWALFAAAWSLWTLALLYAIVDVARLRSWGMPFVVVGMNSILMYVMGMTMKGWTAKMFKIHFGQDIFAGTYGPIVQSVAVLTVFWLICWWLYRQKAFLRL